MTVHSPGRQALLCYRSSHHYQYLFCRNSGHGVGNAKVQFLPHAIEWVWQGYSPKMSK
jgi:hypothetical protein